MPYRFMNKTMQANIYMTCHKANVFEVGELGGEE
jgi:hypothetical protein